MLNLQNTTFIKFLFVGVLNTMVGAGIMFFLYNFLGCSYILSTVANYVFGGILSFFLNKFYTFKSQARNIQEVYKFVLVLVLSYIVAYGTAKFILALLLHDKSIVVQDNIAMIFGMIIYTILNYIGQRFWVFKYKEGS